MYKSIGMIMHHWIVNIFSQSVNMDTLITMWISMALLI